jgi:hypothetical protein
MAFNNIGCSHDPVAMTWVTHRLFAQDLYMSRYEPHLFVRLIRDYPRE